MDDLWFYDINAHRWICCYPGAPTKTLRLRLNADGFEATPAGDLVPVAQQVHGYEMNTYDITAIHCAWVTSYLEIMNGLTVTSCCGLS